MNKVSLQLQMCFTMHVRVANKIVLAYFCCMVPMSARSAKMGLPRSTLLAPMACNEACAGLLLQHGTNVSMVDYFGDTALHKACIHAYYEASVRLLLQYGASASASYRGGHTPMHFA